MADPRAKLVKKMEALKGEFAAKLPDRVAGFGPALEALRADADTARAALATIRFDAHSLAGSGATFGFPKISTLAREIDGLVDVYLDADRIPDAIEREVLIDRAERLVEMANAAAAGVVATDAAAAEGPADEDEDEDKALGVLILDNDPEFFGPLAEALRGFGFLRSTWLPTTAPSRRRLRLRLPARWFSTWISAGTDSPAWIAWLPCDGRGWRIATPWPSRLVGDLPTRLAAVRAGCAAYLFRPVEVGTVADILDRILAPEDEEPFRIMILDDDPTVAGYAEAVLRSAGMITEVVTDSMAALERVEDFVPELILLDLYMPECNGQELAAVIRQQERFAGISIVYLSAEEDMGKQLMALKQGGDEFLTKPVDPDHLIAAVRARAQRFRRLRSLMVRDSMTRLYNHTTFWQVLEKELARARRNDSPVAFAIFDIDRFKAINDTYGHGVGDAVIKNLSQLLKQRLRQSDQIGRLGGEEFGVMLPGSDARDAQVICERVRKAFSEVRHRAGDEEFSVTLSCGITDFPHRETPTELYKAADQALYAAKNGGRNRVVVAEG